jgi:hypothetical protein
MSGGVSGNEYHLGITRYDVRNNRKNVSDVGSNPTLTAMSDRDVLGPPIKMMDNIPQQSLNTLGK